MRGLVAPDVEERIALQEDGCLVAPRPGAEVDHDVDADFLGPADQVVQISQCGGVYLVGRFLGEDARIGGIDEVGA